MSFRSLVAVLSTFFVPAAWADNLLVNPDFTTDIAGWQVLTKGTASASPNAADGSPSAGSAELSVTFDAFVGGSIGFSQCIAVPGAPPWVFGGRVRGVSTTGSYNVSMLVDFLAAPNCGAGLGAGSVANPGASVPGVQGNYVQYTGSTAADPMPGGGPTQSVLVTVLVSPNAGTSVVRVDHMYFGPTGTTPVGVVGFDVD